MSVIFPVRVGESSGILMITKLVDVGEISTTPAGLSDDGEVSSSASPEKVIVNPFQLCLREAWNFRFFEQIPVLSIDEQVQTAGRVLITDPENTIFPLLVQDDPEAFGRLLNLHQKGYYKDGKIRNVSAVTTHGLIGYYIGKRVPQLLEFLITKILLALWQSCETSSETVSLDPHITPLLSLLDVLKSRPLSEADLETIAFFGLRNALYIWLVVLHLFKARPGISGLNQREDSRQHLVDTLHKIQEDSRK